MSRRGTAPAASARSKPGAGKQPSLGSDRTLANPSGSRPPEQASGGDSRTDAAERIPALPNQPKSAALHRRLAQLAAETARTHLALADALAEEAAALTPRPEPWIDIDGAAAHLDMPKSRLYRLTSAGRVPHVKQGQRVRFRRSDLDRWLHEGAA